MKIQYFKFSLATRAAITLMIAAGTILPCRSQATEPRFDIKALAVDANEGIAAGDIDNDGAIDLVAGRSWYKGPEFTSRPLRQIEDWNGYVQSNGDYLFDVDSDGRLDVIAGSFLPSEVYWFKNPGDEALRLGQLWPKHLLVDTADDSNEGQLLADVDGDGRPEWIVNSWQKGRPTRIWRLVDCERKDSGAIYEMMPVTLGETANGHGLGVGDISGDGRSDILVGEGWYEQPPNNPWTDAWTFHRDWDLGASLPILVRDLDGDGRNDLLLGSGHDYGLYWWQNLGPDASGKIAWKQTLIDRRFSQPHSLAMADLDGDGVDELITGKRYFAHNGSDPGGTESPCLYYFRWDAAAGNFVRHVIDEGRVGCGLQIVTTDLNGDGKIDVAVAGKSGTYVITQP